MITRIPARRRWHVATVAAISLGSVAAALSQAPASQALPTIQRPVSPHQIGEPPSASARSLAQLRPAEFVIGL
jgi:predicted cobalt transporter CbtA